MKLKSNVLAKKIRYKVSFFFSLLLLLIYGCKTPSVTTKTKDPNVIFKFVQVNDVYEIEPLGGGKYGGMARVAHVTDSVKKVNPNTFLVMAGDFLNPSLLGTLKLNGERIRGRHMIEVMNAMNFDLATFGNHEFDLSEEDFQKRLNEANFPWTSANVYQQNEDGPSSFYVVKEGDSTRVSETHIFPIKHGDSTIVQIGLFSVTIASNPQEYVYYSDYLLEAKTAYNALQNKKADVILGLTHLDIDQDILVAKNLPSIPLIMGGHEHHNMLVPVGTTTIAKADANAKTVYVHTLTYNTLTKKVTVASELISIDDTVAASPKVKAVVDKWSQVLEEKIKEVIDAPYDIVYVSDGPIDGTDVSNRSKQTQLGQLVTKGMMDVFGEEIDMAIVNAGSFRIDDMLAPEIISLDIFRVLPFGGSVYKVKMKGSLLNEVLDYGESKAGTGAYLQRMNISKENSLWVHRGEAIDDDKTYTVAVSDFLMKGFDIPFLTEDNEGVVAVYKPTEPEVAHDIRKAVIMYLKKITE